MSEQTKYTIHMLHKTAAWLFGAMAILVIGFVTGIILVNAGHPIVAVLDGCFWLWVFIVYLATMCEFL